MAEIIKMPRLSDTMTDGVVVKWYKKIGDKIKEGDLLADIETDKATLEFESFQEGFLLHIGVQENETAAVDSILAILGEKGEDINSILNQSNLDINEKILKTQTTEPKNNLTSSASQASPTPASSDSSEKTVKISPLAKKLAKEKGIDINTISGSGDSGRIIKRDIDNIIPVSSKSNIR